MDREAELFAVGDVTLDCRSAGAVHRLQLIDHHGARNDESRAGFAPTRPRAVIAVEAYAAARLAMAANACGSATAMSASTLRSSTMPDFFRPATSFEYDMPDIRAAALMRAIHRERKSRRRTRRLRADCIIARSTASTARLYV